MNDRPNVAAARRRWTDAWPDALAFGAGLAFAWHFGWRTGDLVWTLWLSSAVVGYLTILWSIFGPGAFIASKVWSDRDMLRNEPKWPLAAGGAVALVGTLLALAFFTAHFGAYAMVYAVYCFPWRRLRSPSAWRGRPRHASAFWYARRSLRNSAR